MAPTPFSLHPSPVSLTAPAVAIDITALAIIAAARTVPTLTLSLVKAALVEAWPIPAVCVEAKRYVLDWSKRLNRQIGADRRAQRRRLDTARHERACSQDRHGRCKGQKKSMHDYDPPWIEPTGSYINVMRACVVPWGNDAQVIE
jgi:hypothetical protein